MPLHMAQVKRSLATMASVLPIRYHQCNSFRYVSLTSFVVPLTAGWQWYDRDKLADPSNMNFRKVQRVNYAFFQPDVQGNIYGTDRWGDPQVSVLNIKTMLDEKQLLKCLFLSEGIVRTIQQQS